MCVFQPTFQMKKYRPCLFVLYVFLSAWLLLSYITPIYADANRSPLIMFNAGGFVTRAGTRLLLNGRPFRFAGANMHWLSINDATLYSSQFQIDDAFSAMREMGITVVRSHSLGISTGCSTCLEPSLGIFQQAALRQDDAVIAAAARYGIKLIIPLTDNYHYIQGGKHNFTDWRGISDENQFFTNAQVMQDFEQYITILLSHVNVYTGVAYKDDPTILAWETGNELRPPIQWTRAISAFLKQLDPNHLVMDGSAHIDPQAASLTNVDIVTNHYYPKSIARLNSDATLAQRAGKVFVVGEFDWNDANGGDKLSNFLAAIEKNPEVAGDAFWEFWPHDDQYGYVSAPPKYLLHYPGDTSAMRQSVQLLRAHAYRMRGQSRPAVGKPDVPVINAVMRTGNKAVITWRGTAIAASYSVARSTISASGPWTVICKQCVTDTATPWTDTRPPPGTVWYQITPYNLAGRAGIPSAPYKFIPTAQAAYTLVDDLNDWTQTYAHSDHLGFDTSHASYLGNDPSRAVRTEDTSEWIVWQLDHIVSFQAVVYSWPDEPISELAFQTSTDGVTWTTVTPSTAILHGSWDREISTLPQLSNVNYVKVIWDQTTRYAWNPQLGQTTIGYNASPAKTRAKPRLCKWRT